jgi:hypothetical protein
MRWNALQAIKQTLDAVTLSTSRKVVEGAPNIRISGDRRVQFSVESQN